MKYHQLNKHIPGTELHPLLGSITSCGGLLAPLHFMMNSVRKTKLETVKKCMRAAMLLSEIFGKLMWMELPSSLHLHCNLPTPHPPPRRARHAWRQFWRICLVRKAPVTFFFLAWKSSARSDWILYHSFFSVVFECNRGWRMFYTPAVFNFACLVPDFKRAFFIGRSQRTILKLGQLESRQFRRSNDQVVRVKPMSVIQASLAVFIPSKGHYVAKWHC